MALRSLRTTRCITFPEIEGAETNSRIDARQTKFTAKGEYRPDAAAIDAVRFWAGATDYKHNEVGLADVTDPTTDGVRQTFTNKEQEGRVEVQLMPFNARFAAVTTALGLQAGHQELTASSPDDPTSPLNGLFDPNKNNRVAGYIFNELKFSDTTKAQIAGRIERVNLTGTTPGFIPDVFDLNVDPAGIGPATPQNLHFTPKSASIGLIQDLPWGLVASITGQYVERAPKPAELFSRGPHEATATFDIGNPNLGIETAKSIEIGLRRATGPLRFEATAYYTKFNGFIYRRLTGNTCEDVACVGPADPAYPLELNQAIYSQRDATFRGGEFQSQLDVGPLNGGIWGIENQFDVVRATFNDGTNVPRIPPVRVWRRPVLARCQLADADQPAARLRAERYRPDRRDADRRLQSPEGGDQLQDQARLQLVRRPRNDGRPGRQQPVEREHPQLGLLQQGRGPVAGHRRARVRESEILAHALMGGVSRSYRLTSA